MTDEPQAAARPSLAAAAADAVRFFTRLPVPARFGHGAPEAAMAGIAAAAPLAGAIVGAAAAATLALASLLGLPALPASVFAAAVGVAISGALHLDGLADCADGMGGGATREAKLAIMRDSRLGTFGGAALALALAARVTLAAALLERLEVAEAAAALIAAAALARPLAFAPMLIARPARDDGLGRSAEAPAGAIAAGVGVAAIVAVMLGGVAGTLLALALAVAAAHAAAVVGRRQLGGYTGDVCGAAAELAEIAALAGFVIAAHGL